MTFKPVLTPQDLETIKELALQGIKLHEIVSAVGNKVSKQRIKQITQKLGIDSFSIRQNKLQSEYTERMFKKWGANWNNKEYLKSSIYKAMKEKFTRKKANAIRNGYKFTVDFGDLEFPTHCPILGIELDYFVDYRAENSVSFDRLDPSKDYVKGNVFIISWRANRIKNDGTAEEHYKIADFIKKTTTS